MEWEYKEILIDSFLKPDDKLTIEEKLNKYGADGWELVGVIQRSQIGVGWLPKGEGDSIIFKKPVTA